METHGLSLFFCPMFEKFTKKIASKATDHAVEGAKESLNDKLETYSGIIKIGLTLGVIIFGSIKINDHRMNRQQNVKQQLNLPESYSHQPIIINNYITDGRQAYGGQRQSYKKH